MKRYVKYAVILAVAYCSFSCSKNLGKESEHEIFFTSDLKVETVETRATLYEDDQDFKNLSAQGGIFHVEAYKSGENFKHLTNGAEVRWISYPERPELDHWAFYSPSENKTLTYYWPTTYALDFFAYMPYNLANTHVTIGDYNGGPTFNCTLPLDGPGQDATREFIYAYATNQRRDPEGNGVELEFNHPFAAIYFKLGGAHSMTRIKSVGLSGAYNNGTFTTSDGKWTTTGERAIFNATVDKMVPEDIQPNTIFAGPYLVIPQSLANVNVTVDFNWGGEDYPKEGSLSGEVEWIAGKKYIYTLVLGDSKEDIFTNVEIIGWDEVPYENNIEVK